MWKALLPSRAKFAWAILPVLCSCARAPRPAVSASTNADVVGRFEVFEIALKTGLPYSNPFHDVVMEASFTSPTGAQHRVRGFYHSGDTWMVRFRPDTAGFWRYTSSIRAKQGPWQHAGGSFRCTASSAEGPVRRHPRNPHRWLFAGGQPFFPIGLQDCVTLAGMAPASFSIDGGGRNDHPRKVSADEYFAIYAQAGFNLFRFSQKNCSYALLRDLDTYGAAESVATDELLSAARRHGFRVLFGFFGYHANWQGGGILGRGVQFVRARLGLLDEGFGNAHDLEKEQRYIDYCVARWGVFVDFWELLNEQRAPDEWTSRMAAYVHSIDSGRKPVTTSWEEPSLPEIEINAPHWYESEPESESSLRVQHKAAEWKAFGKPVVVGEQGNTGMNWDPGSATRMRIRTWTALFHEIALVFWNTSWSKAGMYGGRYTPGKAANIYLGPQERAYTRVLRRFSSRLDAEVRPTPVTVSDPGCMRAYALVSGEVAAVYLHHFSGAVEPRRIVLEMPGKPRADTLSGEWIEPSTGRVIATFSVKAGRRTLDVPSFQTDLAMLARTTP